MSQIPPSNLLLIRTLNEAGEFRQAIDHCSITAQHFLDVNDLESAAQTWLEGAWAQTCLGNLDAAENFIRRATKILPTHKARREIKNKIVWIQARILRDRGDHAAAIQQFEDALDGFKSSGDALNAARVLRELGHTYTFTLPKKAAPFLQEARATFLELDSPVDAALCDQRLAQMHRNLNEFARACELLAGCRSTFVKYGRAFYAASCDLDLGWAEWGLNHFDRALELLERARDYFQSAGAESEVSSCEINIAGIQSEQYRFDEAVPTLQHALEMARSSGRRKKAAVCLESIGWAYDRQGRYARAIEYYLLARDEFEKEGMVERLVMCDMFLGLAYFNLGTYANALTALDKVVKAAQEAALDGYRAEAEMYRGQVLLALGQMSRARRALARAQALFGKTRQTLYAAFCDRLSAMTYARDAGKALAHLGAARRVFRASRQVVEGALCDLTQGELEVAWGEWTHARRHLSGARAILRDSCPDLIWRADYGLGQIAFARNRPRAALAHQLDAIQAITSTRAGLELEEWSNDLFRARQRVFTGALKLAQLERAPLTALAVIEASKAQVLTQSVMQRDWRSQRSWSAGRAGLPYDDASPVLEQRERELRHELAALRGQLSVQVGQMQGELQRSVESIGFVSDEMLEKLHALNDAYNAVVARLRLTRRGLAGVPTLAPFSLDAFREMADARWGQNWVALDYYLSAGKLTIVSIDSESLNVETKAFSRLDQFTLQSCTSTNPDLRELVYRGTLHGQPAAPTGKQYLHALAGKLIPARLRNREQERIVIVSPHGALHQLPFHALMQDDSYLLDYLTFLYTPSLQALVQLHQNPERAPGPERVLLVGLNEFGTRAHPLRHTAGEIQALETGTAGNVTTLWGKDATRKKILDWNRFGVLAQFDVLHLATHAVMEPDSPHSSRILLNDEDLTVLDVMDLHLDARLVMLSACHTALGKGGAGDEIVGLVRAFLYAGARALIASLWAVEDESTGQLARNLYANMASASPADALRAAQLRIRRNGLSPYYWAPFTLVGEG